jgi:glutamyl-Q tRNA(Asp) synthetase
MPTGRFAPSPTGPLHFGSLAAALASWLDARAAGGRWLVRIEDLDPPREQPGAADEILRTLERCGLHWDGDVVFQSRRADRYAEALRHLRDQVYSCGCTRREIADSALGVASDGAQIYPGTCRGGLHGKVARSLRVRVKGSVEFDDRVQGHIRQDLEREVGDFILKRADGAVAYQLAVVVDDAEQGVTDVVRGADLLDSTARQIHLQRLLGLPTPRYLHIPAAVNAAGEKLSKQTGARAAQPSDLPLVLKFLGQKPSATLAEAVANWNPALIPSRRAAALP